MAKGKAKNNSKDSLGPPQTRSLRSKKRECPRDEMSMPDDVQAVLPQGIGENNTSMDNTLPQCRPQESMTSPQQHQAEEKPCLTSQDPATEEKHTDASNVSMINVTINPTEVQEESMMINSTSDPQQEDITVHTGNDVNQSGQKRSEITAKECNTSSETCTDQLQVPLPTSEDWDGSCAAALEKQLDAKENSLHKLQSNQESRQGECNMAQVTKITKELEVGLPPKKKRRMGMCGLTEKERSHFLQAQNGQNGPEGAVKQRRGENDTVDSVAHEEITSSPGLIFLPSVPPASITEQNEAQVKLQSSHCKEDERAESGLHILITSSDGTIPVCDSSSSNGLTWEAEESNEAGPEQPNDTKSDPPSEGRDQETQEPERATTESVAEKPQEDMTDGGDGLAVADQNLVITLCSQPRQIGETESRDAAPLQMASVTKADEEKEELTHEAGYDDKAEADTTSTHPLSGGFPCGSEEQCEAAVSPFGSERKDKCHPDGEADAGPSTGNTKHSQTWDTTEPFGNGWLDYVSDSQLNTIDLMEEEKVMERDEDVGSADCPDATDLICGLIRELSSLNRRVMATHREMESLYRSSKSSRGSTR